MSVVMKILGGLILLCIFIAAIAAYFVRIAEPLTGGYLDGLGRELSPTPLFMRIFLSSDSLSPGMMWHFIDMIWFFGGGYIGFFLISYDSNSND